MSRTRRLKHVATRTIYRRGMYSHGEFIGVILSFFVLFTLSLVATRPSMHADYNAFNPSSGDVSVNYAIDQHPSFVVNGNGFTGKISAVATTFDGRSANAKATITAIAGEPDQNKVTFVPTDQTQPGRYKIVATLDNGKTVTQDFTWGVLAVDMAKSSYLPRENVAIGMAVLDDNGITLCNADTKLQITAPDGNVTTLTTAAKQIKISDTCKDGNVTNNPDYTANYVPELSGNYEVRMTTKTIRGMRSLGSSFAVGTHANFVSERVNTAMRLYPSSPYDVTLNVYANQVFDGSLDEPYPNSFVVTKPKLTIIRTNGQRDLLPQNKFRIDVAGERRMLHWDGVMLGIGDTAELTYTYQPPAVSPAFYELGPASLTDKSGDKVFQEPRAWQLAGDAVNDVILLWDTASGAIPSGWTCVSCNVGDDFYGNFPYADSTYAGTGGADTNTHVYTQGTVSAPSAVTANASTFGGSVAMGTATHTHTFGSPVIGQGDVRPPYKDLEFIKASNPLGLPANAIAMFDVASTAALPTNWASYTPLNDPTNTGVAGNGLYLRGAGDVLTGGATTHTHSVSSITSGNPSATTNFGTGANAANGTAHKHTLPATTSPVATNNPVFASFVFAKLSVANDAIPNGMIAMFDNTTMPRGWAIDTTIGATAITAHLLKGTINATLGAGIGGVTVHNHGGTQTITSGPPVPTGTVGGGNILGQATTGTSTHTHNVPYTIANASSLPAYRSVVLGKFTTVTYSGNIYSDEGVTGLSSAVAMKAAVNGVAQRVATSTAGTGAFSFALPDPGPGGTVTIWSTGTAKAATVMRTNTGGVTGIGLYQNRVVVRHEDAGPISNSDINDCDGDSGTVCSDPTNLRYAVSAGGDLTVQNDTRLFINGGDTFTPGGAVTLNSRAAAGVGGDLKFGSSASALSMGSNALSVGGIWDNSVNAPFTKTSPQTTTMTGTTTGLTINAGTNASNHFDTLLFNGTGGAWTYASAVAANIDSDLTVTNGAVVAPSGAAMTIGDDFSSAGTFTAPGTTNSLSVGGNWLNTGTFTHSSGLVTFTSTAGGKTIAPGTSSFNNVTFNGSGGAWSPTTNQVTIAGDLTMTAGTIDNASAGTASSVVVNGNVVGTAGIINFTSNAFTQRVATGRTFGNTTAAQWTFNDLTFSNSNGTATPVTVSTDPTGTGTGIIVVNGTLRVGASGDATGATTTLNAGLLRIWNLNGTGGNPFQLLGSPAAGFTANTSAFFFMGDNASGNTTIQATTYYKLVIQNPAETFVTIAPLVATLRINVNSGTFNVGGNDVTIGSASVANSGFLNNISALGTYVQTSPGTTKILSSTGATGIQIGAAGGTTFYNLSIAPGVAAAPSVAFGVTSTTGQVFTITNNFTIGDSTNPVNVDASTFAPNISVGGNMTINPASAANTFTAPTSTFTIGGNLTSSGTYTSTTGSVSIGGNFASSGSFTAPSGNTTIGGNYTNSGTFTHNNGTVVFNATTTGKTITTGGTGTGKNFNKVTFNSVAGGWTIQTNNLTAVSDLALTNISALSVSSGLTVEVDGTYSISDSAPNGTSWTGSTLFLNSASNYTVGSKTQSSEVYGTLKVGANTDIRSWNSGATTDTVDSTGSLYSQNDSNSTSALKIYGDYHTIGNDYWRYDTDYDGAALVGGSKRQVIVQIEPGAGRGVTVDSGGNLNARGGGGGTNQFTSIDRQGASGVYHLTNSGTASVQDAKLANASFDGGTWTVLNTVPTNTAVTAGTFNVDWYMNAHLVDRDTPANNVDTASSDITVSESSLATTVFREASGSWGSGGTLQTADSGSTGNIPQPDTDGSLRIREYSQTSTAPTYYNYDIAVSNQTQFANYDYQRDYGKYLTSTANTASSNQQSIGSNWYRDTIATSNADGTLNGAVPNGSWLIGSSKGIIGFWDTASGAIPSGWSCLSCLSGDPFYQKFFRAASTYGGAAGSDNVFHHLTYSSVVSGSPVTVASGATSVASGTHTHTWDFPGGANTDTVDIKPPYKDLQVIRGPVTGSKAWPANIIMPFSTATAPTNWTTYTALDGKYIRGENNNSTGGSTTHINTTNPLTSVASVGTVNALTCSTGCTAADAPGHTHTLAATALPAGNNTPSFINVRFMQHNNTTVPPLRTLVALFDYTSLPTDYYIASNTAPYQNNLLMGANGSIGGTGGSVTDNAGGAVTIGSGVENQAGVNVTPGTGVSIALAAATHNVTYSIDAANAMPAYRDVVVSNYIPQAPPSSPSTLVQAQTNDTVISSGAWGNYTSVKFSAQVTSDNVASQTLQLCVEKKQVGTNFTNTEDSCGTGVTQAPAATVTASNTISGLGDAQYHWQARVKDSFGNYSAWVQFNNTGLNTTVDYGIDSTPPTVSAVYDNTNLDTQPFNTDTAANADGSLTTLSASWVDFTTTISGLAKYQYSFGTTAGAIDVKGWTDNGSNRYVRDTGLALQTSQKYFINVRAVDNAGNTSLVASSDGQIVTPTLSFDIDVSPTDSDTSPPYAVNFGTINPQTVVNSPDKIWVDFQTNGVAGGRVYVASANNGLHSNKVSDNISSSSGDLSVLGSGFGAQVTSATQTSGGPFSYGAPFNGSGNSVGVLNGTFQSIFTSANPITAGRGSFQLKVKASGITKAANDYTDTLTIVAAGTY